MDLIWRKKEERGVEVISDFSEEEIEWFLWKYKDNSIAIMDKDVLGIAFYLRLEDDTLKEISKDATVLEDIENAERLIAESGKNIHFIRVIAENYRIVLRGLKEIIKKENPKTISWYKEDMKQLRFIKFRR